MTEVRLAVADDYPAFMQLAASYLTELRELGSEIQVTDRTMSMWSLLFVAYVERNDGDPLGACVVGIEDSFMTSFSIAGEFNQPMIDTDFGRTAYGHGTYVHPAYRGKGLSSRLRDRLRVELKTLGFETVVGGVHLSNDAGAASLNSSPFVWYQLVGYERL